MRLVHTADWHLGRLFHGVHLTDDQAHALSQLVALVRDVRPHAVVVAGDVYDRAVPPPQAVALLDEVLTRIVADVGVPVVLIAGNHDSPDRLAFGSRLLAARGLHVLGNVASTPAVVRLTDEHGPVEVVALPYAEPAAVRAALGDGEEIASHEQAMRALLAHTGAAAPGVRRVLVAHALAAGGAASDSERPLSVGGADAVPPRAFDGFAYVALGHLHRPQRVGRDAVRYAGSLLKYSFGEAGHEKSVSVVEIDRDGAARIEAVRLTPRRDVRIVRGSLAEVLAGPASGESREDYVCVELTDREAILDAMGKIRQVYPNCLHVDRSAFLARADAAANGEVRLDHRRASTGEIFRAFFAEVTGEPPSEAEASSFADVVAAVESGERSA